MSLKENNRVIILKGKNIAVAKQRLLKYGQELKERDVVIKEVPSSQSFQIALMGKDGGIKWEDDEDFNVIEILKLIDSMPMRKEEIREQKEN